MEKLFLNLFHMSISAGYLILAVLLVRFLLRKVPKSMRMFLWILVGIRLIFPFSVESVFSLIPDTKAVDTYIGEMEQPTGEAAENTDSKKSVSQPIQQNTYPVSGEMVRHKSRTAVAVGMKIWIAGMALMLGYMLYSYLHLRNRVKMSVPADAAAVGCGVINDKNDSVRLYQSDDIESPFLFGILRPRIYIPCNISGDEILYVIQHELTHKRRKDYLIKPLGYLLLSVHWFNPCVWAAYAMFCKDIELICDEHVVRALGAEHKKAYSQALLNSAAKHRMAAACPIAFGEVSVKERVKNVLHYQKPAFWMLAAAVLACIIVPVCFMTQKKAGVPVQMYTQKGDMPSNTQIQHIQKQIKEIRVDSLSTEKNTEKIPAVAKTIEQWAKAFCDRDAKTILKFASEEVKNQFMEQELLALGIDDEYEAASFGWSSPWPWGDTYDESGTSCNYHIVSVTDHSAEILYYAWVSDPHVTVWRETLTYDMEGADCVITSETLAFMDGICVAREFYQAYPDGIAGTMMDYYSFNGAGEALNKNAKENREGYGYKNMFEPDTAAVWLLNILNNPNKVGTYLYQPDTDPDICTVTFDFYEDGSTASVQMIRPYGSDGIWVPDSVLTVCPY